MASSALRQQIDTHKSTLFLAETEDSWETISHGITSLTVICRNGALEFAIDLIPIIQSISRPLINAMNSERTRLSGAAMELVGVLASGLGRTNKVVLTRSRACIFTLVEATQLPSILSYFLSSIKEKSVSLRLVAAEGTLMCMNCFNPPDLEKETRARDIEAIIRTTARDTHPDVRRVGKKLFEAYKLILPSRIESFTNPLTPTIKKYLDIKNGVTSSQPVFARLASTIKVTTQLSSSTSALSSSRVASKPFTQAHTKSASCTISLNDPEHGKAITKPTRHAPLTVSDLDMPPPQYVPVRPMQSSNTVLPVSRSTSSMSSNKMTASGSVSSGTETVRSGLPVRPTSATGRHEGVRRPQCAYMISKSSQESSTSGPRRVPLPVVNSQESDMSKSNRGTRIALTRPVSSHPRSGVGLAPIKTTSERSKPIPQSDIGSSSSTAIPLSSVKSSRSISQPTLSQISRANATQRKPSEKTIPKPTWGQSGRCKTKPLTKSTSNQQTRTVHKTNESQPAPRSTTPCQVPLPLSPSQQAPHPVAKQESDHIAPSIHTSAAPSPAPPVTVEPSTEALPQTEQNEEVSGRVATTTCAGSPPSHPGDVDHKHTLSIPPHAHELSDDCDLEATLHETPKPPSSEGPMDISATPISTLLTSIQNGFLLTPSSPLSPPQSYLYRHSSSLEEEERDIGIRVPSCTDNREQTMLLPSKPFMFGIPGEDTTRHVMSNVENIDV